MSTTTETKESEAMARINSTVKAKLEQEFRDTVYKVYGFKKGNLQLGLEEALEDWIKKKSKQKKK